jgi:hypothetical protein
MCPDRLWSPPLLISRVYLGVLSLRVKSVEAAGLTLTNHPHFVPRSELYLLSPPPSISMACSVTALLYGKNLSPPVFK